MTGDTLTIKGTRKPHDVKQGETWHRRERGSGDFFRTVQLPYNVDAGKVQAECVAGVLKIVLPRAEADKPRKISVKAANEQECERSWKKQKNLNVEKAQVTALPCEGQRKGCLPLPWTSSRCQQFVIYADMRGGDKGVTITLENDVLTIEAQVGEMTFDKHSTTYSEYGVGDYRRAFTLNEAFERDKIEARMKNGVLSVVLPKAEAVKTRSIPIKAG